MKHLDATRSLLAKVDTALPTDDITLTKTPSPMTS